MDKKKSTERFDPSKSCVVCNRKDKKKLDQETIQILLDDKKKGIQGG